MKQIPRKIKINFYKSAESLDDPRKHHTSSSGISDDHAQKNELLVYFISFSPAASTDHWPASTAQEIKNQETIYPHKPLLDKRHYEKVKSMQPMKIT